MNIFHMESSVYHKTENPVNPIRENHRISGIQKSSAFISQNRKKQCHMIFRNHNNIRNGAQETFLIIINDENSSAAQYLCINVILFYFSGFTDK